MGYSVTRLRNNMYVKPTEIRPEDEFFNSSVSHLEQNSRILDYIEDKVDVPEERDTLEQELEVLTVTRIDYHDTCTSLLKMFRRLKNVNKSCAV
jgi:hypothetical protein